MANNERRSSIPLIIGGVIVAALAMWLGMLGFRVGRCSNDDFGTRHHR